MSRGVYIIFDINPTICVKVGRVHEHISQSARGRRPTLRNGQSRHKYNDVSGTHRVGILKITPSSIVTYPLSRAHKIIIGLVHHGYLFFFVGTRTQNKSTSTFKRLQSGHPTLQSLLSFTYIVSPHFPKTILGKF